MALELKNPHSVLAAIDRRPLDVFEIIQGSDSPSPAWREVIQAAAASAVRVTRRAQPARDQRSGDRAGRETLMSASVRERPDVSLDDLFQRSQIDSPTDMATPEYGLWLALDNLQDTHNVGAIFRTAAFFGVRGIVVTKDRSAPMNGAVYDVAAGGVEQVPFAMAPNLARAISLAKQMNVWVLGTSEHAAEDVAQVPRDRHWLLVVGNEEHGMRRLTSEHCDSVCRITPHGELTSLNVSVATGILIATLCRR